MFSPEFQSIREKIKAGEGLTADEMDKVDILCYVVQDDFFYELFDGSTRIQEALDPDFVQNELKPAMRTISSVRKMIEELEELYDESEQ